MDTDRSFALFWLTMPLLLPRCSRCVDVNLITVIFDDDHTTGYRAIAPVYDVAVEQITATYSVDLNVTIAHYTVYNGTSESGNQDDRLYETVAGVFHLTRQLKSNSISALFSSGRNHDTLVLGDFAREMKIPFFASSAADGALTDRHRFPTTVLVAPSNPSGYAPLLQAYLDRFAWRYLTLLCDLSPKFLAAAPMNLGTCTGMRKYFANSPTAYAQQTVWFNSESTLSFRSTLRTVQDYGHIIIAVTREDVMRQIMIDAGNLGMTDGKYVFIYLQPVQTPDSQVLSWMYHDRSDVIAFAAFKRLVVFSYVGIQWSKITPLLTTIADKSATSYSTKLNLNSLNAYAVSAYESMAIFAQMLNRSQESSKLNVTTAGSDDWEYRLTDRIFTLDSGTITIDRSGLRRNNVVIFYFNENVKNFKPAWYFSAEINQLVAFNVELTDRWPGGSAPVSDRFVSGDYNTVVVPPVLGIGIVGTLIVIAASVWLVYTVRMWLQSRANNSTWWKFELERFTDFNHVKVKNYAAGIPATDYGFALATLDEETVWIQTSSSDVSHEDVSANNTVRRILAEIHALRHGNIGQLHGITFHDNRMDLIWPYGRGTLRSLLENEKFQIDMKLKIALIFELISGMEAIHSTGLYFHGSLSSLTATVDHLYSIKICSAGASRIFAELTDDRSPVLSTPLDLWFAPEMLKDRKHCGSREADVYAVGIVICEILAGNSFFIDLDSSDSTYGTWTQLMGVLHGSLTEVIRMPEAIKKVITDCFSFQTKKRPTIQRLRFTFAKSFQKSSVMEQMLKRFQTYSDNLEQIVATRTEELIFEEQKTIALLAEMMPPALIPKLRNKEVIAAETFQCVTLFFSSLVGFAEFCQQSAPLGIINLLNVAYIMFDQSLHDYDVYKVETIKDGYMVASGLPIRNGDIHASEITAMAQGFLKQSLQADFLKTDFGHLEIRIGIHSGTVAACVVGNLMPRYCLFGDTVNTGSRMESHGAPSKIHVSGTTAQLLQNSGDYCLKSRGLIPIKGKGEMETFWLETWNVRSDTNL